MISKTILIAVLMCALAATKTSHPLKFAVVLLMFSVALMADMSLKSTITIFPQLYFMMFAGGILVLMLVLSALSPNQKMTPKKKMMCSLLAGGTICGTQAKIAPEIPLKNLGATMLENSENFLFLMTVILIYFTGVVKIMDSMKNAMRTFC